MNLRQILIYLSIFIAFSFITSGVELNGQNISEDVKKAFETGNANLLSKHLSSKLTLNITEHEEEMTNEQARKELEIFFNVYNVKSFDINFEGEKDNSNFLIGTLTTDIRSFRINIFFKKYPEGKKIHLLRIEKENESEF